MYSLNLEITTWKVADGYWKGVASWEEVYEMGRHPLPDWVTSEFEARGADREDVIERLKSQATDEVVRISNYVESVQTYRTMITAEGAGVHVAVPSEEV